MDGRRSIGPYEVGWERERELLKEAEEGRLVREVRAASRRCVYGRHVTPHEALWMSLGGWILAIRRLPGGS